MQRRTSCTSPKSPSSAKLGPTHERSVTPFYSYSKFYIGQLVMFYCFCVFRGQQMDLILYHLSPHHHTSNEWMKTQMMLSYKEGQILLLKNRGDVNFRHMV